MVKTELSNVEKILSDHLADKTTESGNGPSFFLLLTRAYQFQVNFIADNIHPA